MRWLWRVCDHKARLASEITFDKRRADFSFAISSSRKILCNFGQIEKFRFHAQLLRNIRLL